MAHCIGSTGRGQGGFDFNPQFMVRHPKGADSWGTLWPVMELIAHEIDVDVMILFADGGLNASNAEEFVSDIGELIDGGLRRLIID